MGAPREGECLEPMEPQPRTGPGPQTARRKAGERVRPRQVLNEQTDLPAICDSRLAVDVDHAEALARSQPPYRIRRRGIYGIAPESITMRTRGPASAFGAEGKRGGGSRRGSGS